MTDTRQSLTPAGRRDLPLPFRNVPGRIVIRIKRVYEPVSPQDGVRILVERLWPRGLRKEDLAAHEWVKEVAPSAPLRQWFGHEVGRWEEFRRRYRRELRTNPEAWEPILAASAHSPVTLLYSARDTEHNSAVVLREYLIEHTQPRGPGARKAKTRSSPHQ